MYKIQLQQPDQTFLTLGSVPDADEWLRLMHRHVSEDGVLYRITQNELVVKEIRLGKKDAENIS